MTVYYKDDQLGVCSRNLELVETEGNSQWGIVTRYDLKKKLEKLNRNIAIQGEIIGYGIQKNHYKLNEVDLRVFKVWDITRNDYLAFDELSQLTGELGLQTVPVLEQDFRLPEKIGDLLEYADDVSALYDGRRREGIVFYSEQDSNVHFKVISNEFLEKEG